MGGLSPPIHIQITYLNNIMGTFGFIFAGSVLIFLFIRLCDDVHYIKNHIKNNKNE